MDQLNGKMYKKNSNQQMLMKTITVNTMSFNLPMNNVLAFLKLLLLRVCNVSRGFSQMDLIMPYLQEMSNTLKSSQ